MGEIPGLPNASDNLTVSEGLTTADENGFDGNEAYILGGIILLIIAVSIAIYCKTWKSKKKSREKQNSFEQYALGEPNPWGQVGGKYQEGNFAYNAEDQKAFDEYAQGFGSMA